MLSRFSVDMPYGLAYTETQYTDSLRTRNKSVFVTKMIGMMLREPIVKRRSLATLLAKEICRCTFLQENRKWT